MTVEDINHKVAVFITNAITGLGLLLVLSTILWLLWDKTMMVVFGLPSINWLQAVGLFIIARIIFRNNLISEHTCDHEEEEAEEEVDLNDKT